MKQALAKIAVAWGGILLFLFVYTDIMLPKSNQNSDYLMTFHTAGQLVREGKARELYPPADATTFSDTDFDKAAHRVLPLLPARSTAEYMYMPMVAGIFTPFSLLEPSYSLLAWQMVSLTALVFASLLIFAASKEEGTEVSPYLSGWIALTLIPLAISVWIGQVSVVFGVLPLAGGLYFLMKRKDLAAGAAWSLCVIKPQFFIPALIMTAALVSAKRFKPAIGITGGIASVIALNVALFSSSMFGQWLTTLKLAETVYSNLKFGVAQHLATSLPRSIILLTPIEQHTLVKPLVYGLSALLGAIGLYYASKLFRSNLPDNQKAALAAIIAIFATPIIVPHVFFYDYSIFVVAAFLAYAIRWPEALGLRVKTLLWSGWVVVNLYAVLILTNKNFASPILFVLIMLELYRRALSIARTALTAPGIAVMAPESASQTDETGTQ